MLLLKLFLVNLILLNMIAYPAFAQRSIEKYKRSLIVFLNNEALQLEDSIQQNDAFSFAIFSPCSIPDIPIDKAVDLVRYRYNDALLKYVQTKIADVFEDSIKLKNLIGDTIVTFKTLWADIKSLGQNYTSSKILIRKCDQLRSLYGLSTFGEVDTGLYSRFEQNLRTDTFIAFRNKIPDIKFQAYGSLLYTFVREQRRSFQEKVSGDNDLQSFIFRSCQLPNATKTNAEDLAAYRFVLELKKQIARYLDDNYGGAVERKQFTGGIGISMYDLVNEIDALMDPLSSKSDFITDMCHQVAKTAETNSRTQAVSFQQHSDSTKSVVSSGIQAKGPKDASQKNGSDTPTQINRPALDSPNPSSYADNRKVISRVHSPNLTFIVFTSLGGVLLACLFLFNFRNSRQLKIVAITIDEMERDIVGEYVHHAQKTKAFTIGYTSGYKIEVMRRRGLLVHVLDTGVQVIKTPGNTKKLVYSNKEVKPQVKKVVFIPAGKHEIGNLLGNDEPLAKDGMELFPLFYIISLDSPIMPEYSVALEKYEIEILQYLPHYNYVVCIKEEQQLNQLRDRFFYFIKHYAPYSGNDTGVIGRLKHNDDKITVNLILHRKSDQGFIRESLFFKELPVIASYDNVLRTVIRRDVKEMKRLAANKYVRAIYEYIEPRLINHEAGKLIGNHVLRSRKFAHTFTGRGEIVAIADSGIDELHPDIVGQIIGLSAWGKRPWNDCSDGHGHGTHIAGTIVGTGTASGGRNAGIAPGAKIFFQSLMNAENFIGGKPADIKELLAEAYQFKARIFNLSWGANYNSQYETDSENADAFVYDHKDMLIIAAAGNDGQKSNTGAIVYSSINSPGTFKNGITAGASSSKNIRSLDPISSRGPCSDWRIKPDLVVPASFIQSTLASTADENNFLPGKTINKKYGYMGGSSMAAAIISGAAAIVRQCLLIDYNDAKPSAALVKAILINSSRMLKSKDALRKYAGIPNNNQGFGMLDLSNAFPVQGNFFFKYWDTWNNPLINMQHTGDGYLIKMKLNKVSWIRACLSYTDIAVSSTQLLIFIVITHQGKKITKWVGNKSFKNPRFFIPKSRRDEKNNVEVIRIDSAPPGGYAVKIFGYNLRQGQREDFALVITAGDNGATITHEEAESF